MNIFAKSAPESSADTTFELLRSRVEREVMRPGVIVITSASGKDGKEVAAYGLAQSLSTAGYLVLVVDTDVAPDRVPIANRRLVLSDVAGVQEPANKMLGGMTMVTVSGRALQTTTSQRDVTATFDELRSKFDYVIVTTEMSSAKSFAASVVSIADVVLATVRLGRSASAGDAWLVAELERTAGRFFGVVALAPKVIDRPRDLPVQATITSQPASQHIREYRREIVESAT